MCLHSLRWGGAASSELLKPKCHLTVTFLICGSLLRAQKGQGSGQALSIVNTKDGPRKKPLWAKQQFCPGPRAHGSQADSGAGGVGGCVKQSHHFPLHSRKLWIIFRFPFCIGSSGDTSLAAVPSPKYPVRKASSELTLAGYQDRVSPRLPALSTPRGSDIRGSRGLIMQQAQRPEGVLGEPGLQAEARQH